MTTREALHTLVDELPEDQAELARFLLEDLQNSRWTAVIVNIATVDTRGQVYKHS